MPTVLPYNVTMGTAARNAPDGVRSIIGIQAETSLRSVSAYVMIELELARHSMNIVSVVLI